MKTYNNGLNNTFLIVEFDLETIAFNMKIIKSNIKKSELDSKKGRLDKHRIIGSSRNVELSEIQRYHYYNNTREIRRFEQKEKRGTCSCFSYREN